MQIGSLRLASRAVLAPLEGVSDAGFRQLCAANGASLTFVEMLRASAVARRNAAALALIDLPARPTAAPTGVQLLAGSADELLGALRALEALADTTHPHFRHIRAIDLNLGCPSPAVISDGKGPALLKRRARLAALFTALARWREGNSLGVGAVGAKLRLGLSAREAMLGVACDAGVAAADAGLDFVTVHGRHAAQGSSEPADWAAIARVVAAVRARSGSAAMAVLCNGDVRSRGCAAAALAATGADGVMLARAAFRNPAVFRELAGLQPGELGGARERGWPPGGAWLSPEEVDAAEGAWRAASAAAPGGARGKHAAFHAANFARLRLAGADVGRRASPPPRVASEHLS